MNIPPRLHIHVSNYQPLQIVKAITSDNLHNPQAELKDDQLFTPTIAVLDAATGTPLNCVVTLVGDKDAPATNVCFIGVTVRPTEVNGPETNVMKHSIRLKSIHSMTTSTLQMVKQK